MVMAWSEVHIHFSMNENHPSVYDEALKRASFQGLIPQLLANMTASPLAVELNKLKLQK